MIVKIKGFDESFLLVTRERTTLRELANSRRLTLRRWGSYQPQGAIGQRNALSVDVSNPKEPADTRGFDITEEVYKELLAMGVPEA